MSLEATLHIRLDPTLKGEIEKLAEDFSVKPAVIVRMALEQFIDASPEPTTRISIPSNF